MSSPLPELSSDIEDSPTLSPCKRLWSLAPNKDDLGTADSTSSPLPELSSDNEDFNCPTPCKRLWSSAPNKPEDDHGVAKSDDNDFEDFEDDSDTSEDGPLPPPTFPSSDFIYSSPLVGTKQQIKQKKEEKRQRQKAKVEEGKQAELEVRLLEVLNMLQEKNLRFSQLLEFVFNPAHGQGSIRWHQFFAKKDDARQILDFWVSAQNSKAARDIVHNWALDYVAGQIAREVRSVTKSKILQTRDVHLDQEFVSSFSLSQINELLSTKTPVAMRMLEAFSTSRHAETAHSARRKERTMTVSDSHLDDCFEVSESKINVLIFKLFASTR